MCRRYRLGLLQVSVRTTCQVAADRWWPRPGVVPKKRYMEAIGAALWTVMQGREQNSAAACQPWRPWLVVGPLLARALPTASPSQKDGRAVRRPMAVVAAPPGPVEQRPSPANQRAFVFAFGPVSRTCHLITGIMNIF